MNQRETLFILEITRNAGFGTTSSHRIPFISGIKSPLYPLSSPSFIFSAMNP